MRKESHKYLELMKEMRIQLRKFVKYNEKNAQREFYIIQFFDQKEEEKI